MKLDNRQAILETAQEMIRQGGYHGFSFRKIADQIGIKSSSVHYHFANKEELGAALAKQYTDSFRAALGDPVELVAKGENPLASYVSLFQRALLKEKGMCLCGIFGTEAEVLPDKVVEETRNFFNANIDWLERAFVAMGAAGNQRKKAIQAVSLLEGAMLVSNALGDTSLFNHAAELLLSDKT